MLHEAAIRTPSDFRAVLEELPTAILAVAPDGTIMFVNAQTEQLFGYARSELIGRAVEMLLPEAFRERHPELRRFFSGNPRARPMGHGRDLYGLRGDGRQFPLEIGLNPIRTEEGQLVLAAVVDLTERKRAQQDLQAAVDALEASNLELHQFAYIASHDLQEPLRTVSGYAQLLQMEYGGRLDDEAEHYITTIVQLLGHMQALVGDLHSMARVEAQSRPMLAVELGTVLEESVRLLESSIMAARAGIEIEPLPCILGDAPQLTHLFVNLLSNSLKFVAGTAPRIRISAERDADRWQISVADNGIGIDPENHEKIFQIFRRAHSSEEFSGTGLGLALCRRIVHRHGGRIWVESRPGEGSVFRFTLHAADSQAAG